jgi:thimet oligopeptidase
MIAGLLLIPCCVSKPKKEEPAKKPDNNPLIIPFNNNFDFKNIKPGHIAEGTDYVISQADFIKNEIIQIADAERTYENTLVRIDDIYTVIESVWSPGYLMGSVHTSEEIRNEGLEASKKIENYITKLSLNEDLYNAVVAYVTTAEAKSLKGFRKKYLDDLLLDYKRIGFTLSKDEREKVKAVLDVLTDLGLEFDKNIRAAQDTLFLDPKDLAGLPDNYKKERLQNNGKYAIDMTYPSYVPFMDQAESDEAREALRFKFNNRARAENIGVLNDILRNRMKMVKLLGYNSYAEYRTEDRMARNPKNVWDFENNLKQQLREKAENDVAEMLTIKSVRLGKDSKTIHPWEAGFYENQVKLKKYNLDREEVRQYFEFNNVTEGLFTIYQRLFNVRFEKVQNASVWHEDVQMFSIYDKTSSALIGNFYLDMFPRPNKYGHAAAFSVVMGKMTENGYQKPATALVCNFPKPTDFQPSLLTHENVETYFHEFGHLVHGVLTTSQLISYAGTSVARDFVEAPSQMLENWVWQKESLSLFAKHYETGEVIPEELLEKMIAAKNINSGTKALQQIFYGIFDFTLNDGFDPDGNKSTTDLIKELKNEITFYPYQEGTHQQASFGHLNGYGAAYYGYKWSEVYAQDMFSVFKANGILNPDIGLKYRRIILEKGGTVDPYELVKEFLGREPNSEAFLRSMGI